jgi:hypothetical protein
MKSELATQGRELCSPQLTLTPVILLIIQSLALPSQRMVADLDLEVSVVFRRLTLVRTEEGNLPNLEEVPCL